MPLFLPGRRAAHRALAAGALLVASPLAPLRAQSLDAATAPYWQQEVAYSIDVKLDDRRHELTGTEELTYVNNSPDALPFIWLHLWPNAYRDNHTAYARQQLHSGSRRFQFAPDSLHGFIDQLAFTADGAPATLELDRTSPDMARLTLPRPLAPGARVVLRTPFRVKLPFTFSRGGHMGRTYQITQWYPKPAVYDRAGWHPMPYLDQGEFYSEYGSFDVRITLPANYVVAATGQLQNPEEATFLDSLAARSARLIAGKPTWPKKVEIPPSAAQTKTLRYVQDHVHDFAWFADKRFLALKSGVTLPQSGRRVATWLFFPGDIRAKDWIERRGDIDAAVLGYSRLVGEYPYAAASAVSGPLGPGTGGMEYPMVTITEPSAIVHEVGHNWFYGVLGSNERDYPWMDEGINSYIEARINAPLDSIRTGKAGAAGNAALGLGSKTQRFFGFDKLPPSAITDVAWQASVSRGLSQPIGLRSTDFRPINYGTDVYLRTPAELRYLAAYLGQARFDSCMHAYYRRWQFRHPYPADILASFEQRSGEDLDWFFRDQLTTNIRPDAALTRLSVGSDSIRVRIFNEGDSLLTVPVATVDRQGHVLSQRWTPLFREQGLLSLPLDPAARAVVIDPTYVVPTVRRVNDRLRLRGPLRSWNHPTLRPLLGPERWDGAPIYWMPILGANTTDKFMLGAWLSTSSLVQRRMRVTVAPLYSFSRNQLNGYGQLAYSVLPPGRVGEVLTAVNVARFADYLKIEPMLTLRFRQLDKPENLRQTVTLALTAIRRDRQAGDEPSGSFGAARWLRYDLSTGNALHRFDATAELYNYYASALTPRLGPTTRFDGANLAKLTLRGEQYYTKNKAVSLRIFGGRFIGRAQDFVFMGLSGSPDYLRQTIFLDRARISQMLEAGPRQTDDRDGAFHAWVPVYANRWLASASLQADIPFVPLSLYGDLGAARGATASPFVPQRTTSYYGAGLILRPFGSETLRVYLPLAGSNFRNGESPGSWGEFSSNIRFALNITNLAPERQLRKLLE